MASEDMWNWTTLTNTIPVCVQHTNLLSIYHLEELLDLLILGRLVVILLYDGRVLLRINIALV
jgi:hypothetical protein